MASTDAVRVVALADHPAALPVVAGWLHREWLQAWHLSRAQALAEIEVRLHRRTLPLALVALAGRTPVGTASLVDDAHPSDATTICSLAGVYVTPRWRRRGIGRLLCTRAVALAAELGRQPVGLYTLDAEAYYLRLGWTKVVEAPLRDPLRPTPGAYMEWRRPASAGGAREQHSLASRRPESTPITTEGAGAGSPTPVVRSVVRASVLASPHE